ncbi:hypothetical protein RJT34_10378 [Clitoria ternatea]|uniref:WRKY domain-containing protein n=1 Tax=Clitoria ternatea TaxID=43366 RepID=A0AAN9K8C7_CLITE
MDDIMIQYDVRKLEAKLQHAKEENRSLRLMLEAMSNKGEKLHSNLQEINNAEQIGPALARSEFSQAPNLSQFFVRTHPNDNSLTIKDGYQWRKYGQKFTKDNSSPRAYFKCSLAPSCPVKKKWSKRLKTLLQLHMVGAKKHTRYRSILVATYEGKHNHDVVLHDTLRPSSSSSKVSAVNDNLPITTMPNHRGAMNIDLALCGWARTDRRVCEDVVEQQKDLGSSSKIEECVSCLTKDPNFTMPLAEAAIHSTNNQSTLLGVDLNLGLPDPQV